MTRTLTTLLTLLLLLAALTACDTTNGATATAPGPSIAAGATGTSAPGLRATPPAATPAPDQPDPIPTPPSRTVMVHLFEWTWPDIALECENVLARTGYVAVQVSPPQEHVVFDHHPWWQRYQPVSYQLVSRSGDRAQFADMVARCNAVGIDIYVDAVINHMAGVDSGTGSAGTQFTHYEYPGLYGYDDFHHCGLAPFDDIADYNDPNQVRTCELVNLADLDLSRDNVRAHIVAYLTDLIDLGVAGFRFDAAKHMHPDDLAAIIAQLPGDPYIYQEVIGGGGEPITPAEYTHLGDVTEFRYGLELGRIFSQGRLAELQTFGESWGMLPSSEAIVFVDNHDNQRGHGGGGNILMHEDGALYELAVVFMLGYPYGYPRVMSSYQFDNGDQGPPAFDDGATDPVYDPGEPGDDDCYEGWVCEHRWGPIAAMVGFHNFTAGTFFVNDWWDNGNDQIAFGRGDTGFLVINREDAELSRTFQTGLPAGTYCNVIEGGLAAGADGTVACTGPTITVDDSRQATITVPPMRAAALHIGARQD